MPPLPMMRPIAAIARVPVRQKRWSALRMPFRALAPGVKPARPWIIYAPTSRTCLARRQNALPIAVAARNAGKPGMGISPFLR